MGKFKDSPFVTPLAQFTEPEPRTRKNKAAKVVYRAKDDRENPRTRRVQLLFRPDMYEKIQRLAKSKRLSVNNCIEDIITLYLAEQKI